MNEHRSQKVSLLDLNQEGKYEVIPVLDADLHPTPVRLAARLLDPDAFIICSAMLKTHNVVVATLSVKNMALGAPLRSAPKETPNWNDKRKYHGGVRQTHYDIMLTAQKPGAVLGRDGDRWLRGDGRQRSGVGHAGAFARRHRLDGLHRRRPCGHRVHGREAGVGRLSALLLRGRPGTVRSGEDRCARREDRRGAQEIPAAPRSRARVAVDGSDGRGSREVRVIHFLLSIMKVIVLALLLLLVSGIAVVAEEYPEFISMMKMTGQAMGALNKMEKKTGPQAARVCRTARFGLRGDDSVLAAAQCGAAVKISEEGKAAAAELASAAFAGDAEKADAAFKTIGATCKTCHDARAREMAEGKYRIK